MDLAQIKQLTGNSDISDAIKAARDDFRFVLSQSNFLAPNYLDYQSIVKSGVTLGYALAIPFDIEERQCTVPARMVKTDDPKMFVALVCYQGKKPIDVLMFNSAMFARTIKPIKFDKRNEMYILSIKDIKHSSMEKHAFGYVIGNL